MTDTLNNLSLGSVNESPTLAQGARIGMSLGINSNPDFEAELRKASQITGVPVDAARTYPDDVKRQAQLESTNFDGLAEQFPNTAKLLTNVENARIAHDDVKSMSSMETLFSALGDVANYVTSKPGQNTGLVRDIAATGLKAPQYLATAQRATFDTMGYFLNPYIDLVSKENNPIRYFADEGGKAASYYSKLANETASQWNPNSLPAQIFGAGATSGVQSAVQNMGTGVLASWLLGPEVGIPVTLAVMAGGSGLEAYQKAREKGVGVLQSLAYGAEDATAEYTTEKYFGMAGFLDKAFAGASAKKLLMYEITKEIPGEMAATVWQNFNEWLNINPEKPISKFLEEQPVALAQTVVATLVGGGGQIGAIKALEAAGNSLFEHEQKLKAAENQKIIFDHIDGLVGESKLKARDAEVFNQFVQANTDGTPAQDIYISANALNQSGIVDQLAQISPSVREQFGDAMASDGYVRIPMSEYMTNIAGTALNQSIIDNVKLDPNGYTFAESDQHKQTFDAEIQTKLEKMMAEKSDDQAFKASRDAIKDTFLGQLNQAKRFTPDANEAYATMLANFYSVTAAKLGITPEELVNKYQLNIAGNLQNNAQFDQEGKLITETPNFTNWFQESKVVDAAGKPLVVYHGTQALGEDGKGIAQFKMFKGRIAKGAYFANNTEVSDIYAGKSNGGEQGNVLPVYLSLQNPATEEDMHRVAGDATTPAEVTKALEDAGYDGLIIKAGENSNYYVAFHPSQIKSVFNDGSFNPDSHNILNQDAGKLVPTTVDAVANVEAAFEFAGTNEFPTNRDFKVKLQERVNNAAKEAKVDLSDFSKETEAYIVRMAYADGITALRTNANAVGWYNEKVTKALRLVSLIHPEIISDPQAKFAFVWAMAVTSNGLKVDKNFELAEQAYEAYKSSSNDPAKRVMPTNIGIGTAAAAINKTLGLYNSLIKKYGFAELEKFMTTMQTVKQVEAFTGQKVSGENLTTQVYGAAALGPKIGNGFFMNLYGHFEQLTMDRWLMRTWGRWTGTLIEDNPAQVKAKRTQIKELIRGMSAADKKAFEKIIKRKLTLSEVDDVALAILKASQKPANRIEMAKIGMADDKAQELFVQILGATKKGQERISFGDELRKGGNALSKYLDGQKEAPSGPPERGNIRKVFGQVLDKLQQEHPALTMSDYQALLWYPEKRLYDAAKTEGESVGGYEDDEAPDYANAAAKLARSKGISEEQIAGAIAAVDRELQAANSAAGVRPGAGRPGNGTADQGSNSLNQSVPTFYSQLNKAVTEAKQTKAPASDWLSIISKLPGVKAEEMEWTGLKDYLTLEGKQQLSKEQILSFLAQHGVQIQEVVKGEQTISQAKSIAADDMREVMEAGGSFDDDAQSALDRWLNAEPESRLEIQSENLLEEKLIEAGENRAVYEFMESAAEQANDAKYGQYVLDGGTNYRELLLTLPVQMSEKDTARMMKLEADRRRYTHEWIFDHTEEGKELKELQAKSKANVYRSSHWNEDNVLAHIRVNDRIDSDGKRVLFVEELQSDWAQEGRKRGFSGGVVEAEAALKKFTDDMVAKYGIDGMAEGKDTPEEQAEFARLSNVVATAKRGVPQAPFVKDTKGWLDLALKRITMMAVADGYDKVAFVNGEQSAQRYDLSKHIEFVGYDPKTKVLEAYDSNRRKVLEKTYVEPADLPDYIGKEVADRLLASEQVMGKHAIEGQDLKIGGEGMKAFYDKIVPQQVNALLKKIGGGKVETVNVKTTNTVRGDKNFTYSILSYAGKDEFYVVKQGTDEVVSGPYTDGEEARAWLQANDPALKTPQLGFEITDKMRQEVMKGQSLFQNTGGTAPRGQIFFGQDITTQPSVIALLDGADLSTFIHESGHFFLQVQADLAARIQSQISAGASVSDEERGIVDDMNKTLEWMGIHADMTGSALDRWSQMSLEEQRPYHEMWARGFEAYAFEGKAPTMEMQAMFQKFRSWLVAVYRTIKDALIGDVLQVKLTDEVRSVMDRMLATADQIKAAEDARNMGPLFNAANAADIIDDWRAYHELANASTNEAIDELNTKKLRDLQWFNNARDGLLKVLQKQHDELRQDVRREVIREVMSKQVYQVWQFLTNKQGEEFVPGVTDGSAIVLAHFSGKLRTDVLRDMYGTAEDAVWRRLSALRMTSDSTGMHPDLLAEMAGYDSADAMVQDLAKAMPPSQVVDAITDQRMLERHGDLATPEAMQQAADVAVHSQMRAKMLHAEARALERAMEVRAQTGEKAKNGRPISYAVLPKAAKDFAERMISKLKVRDIKPAQYAAAESKAAKEAERAFTKGDLEAAAMQKRNQIINNYATREAYRIQEEVRKAVAYLRKFDKKSKGLDADYYDQIAQMLERFDLVPSTSLKEIDKRTALTEWLLAKQEEGIMPEIPPIFEKDFRTSYKNMTVEQLLGLRDTIKQLDHLGRLKQKLMNAKDKRDFEVIRDEMVASIEANSRGRMADNVTPSTVLGEQLVKVKEFGAQHIKIATLARIMDGGVDGGPVWEHLIRTANLANNQEVKMREAATRELSALIAPVLAQGNMKEKAMFFAGVPTSQDAKQGKTGSSFTKEARLAMALNMGNASNMQRLLGGEGWTLAQIKPILDTLTAADWTFVQSVWDYFESYRPLIAEKERRVYGVEPKWIDAQALTVQTADGQTLKLRGGYYPVKFDSRRSQKSSQNNQLEEAKRMMQGAYTSATTRRSFTKSRVEEVNGMPLMYTMDGLYNGINEVIHDLSWHEWLIDTNRLVKDPKISEAIRDIYGFQAHDQIKLWIQQIADGGRSAAEAGAQFMSWMRQGVSIAGIGLNVMSALIQPVGITNSWVRIGGKHVMIGIQKSLSDPIGTYREVCDMSDFMRARGLTTMRELAELKNQVKGQSKLRNSLDSAAYALMLRAQQLVDVPTWWGAYEKAMSEGHAEDKAIDMADQAVIDSQGDGTINNQSAVERGGPGMKALTVFYSFQNALLNLGVAQTMTKTSNAKLTGDYMLLFVAPVILTSLLKAAFTPGDSGDWDDLSSIARKLLKEEISQLMGLFVGVREFANLYDAFEGKSTGEYSGPSGFRIIPETMRLAKQIGQMEFDDQLRKTIVNEAGLLLRLPSAQINRTITGAQALSEGKTSNPAALVFGYETPH